jgi:3-hydroxyacyl-[acyl-carrier-protein] dehydratase
MRFVLVDDIVQMTPGKRIHSVKTLAPSEPLFEDHFPGFAVVPGVLLIEMMAQTAGKCLDAEDRVRGKAMLAQVQRASFRNWVRPGERADIRAEITASAAAYARASCRVIVGDVEVADGDLLFAFVKYDQLAPGYRDEVLERYNSRQGPTDTPA